MAYIRLHSLMLIIHTGYMTVKTIGIVGGGQLGRMLTEAALPLSFKVIVVDPSTNCPAAQAGARQIKAHFTDAAAISKLANECDVVTIEFEHINTEVLAKLQSAGKLVEPSPATIAMIQDKLTQNEFLRNAGLPIAEFQQIDDFESGLKVLKQFGSKILLKKRHESYDGKGNAVVKNEDELRNAIEKFGSAKLYAEKFIAFTKELAVIIARDLQGNIKVYPAVETVHVNNICHEVFEPAPIDKTIIDKAENLGLRTAQHLDGAGIFAIEMFLGNDSELLINEIAPRVHNSGHLTLESNKTSQFEQHIRAITGLELGSVDMKVPAAVMINILGDRDGPAEPKGLEEAEKMGDVYVHIYGKAETRVGRKMGHITVTADTLELAKKKAEKARSLITI